MSESRPERIARLGYDYAGQPKDGVSRCNLCEGSRFVVLAHRDRYGFPASAHGCLRCGLVFLNPVMTAAAYRDFYVQTYRPLVSAYHGRRIDAETIQDEQRVYAAERAELLAPFLPTRAGGSLLDIGGSTGVVASHFARVFGLKAAILDPAPLEIEHARRLGLESFVGLLEEFEPNLRRFDVVTMCQTVDHLLDVAGAMRKVRRLLVASGLFFVDIVDLRAAYLRSWSVEEAIKVDHPFYLTAATMTAYLVRAGFEVLRVDYATDHLHVGYVCRRSDPVPDFLPPAEGVERLWREIRRVQNAPRGA